jgi:hypothetical protein
MDDVPSLERFQVSPNWKSRLTGSVLVNTATNIYFGMVFSLVTMAALSAHAATVNYTLENVILLDGEQITGTFDWTFNVDDFEGGSGVFTALEIPYTPHYLGDPDLNIEIQTTSIEITGIGNSHDAGLDISLKFGDFTPTQSASIDRGLSFFECCGNGFKDQPFISGSISPLGTVWDGGADLWASANWSSGLSPATNQAMTIDASNSDVVTVSGAASANSLDVGGTFTSELQVDDTLTVSNGVTIHSGGTLSGTGTITGNVVIQSGGILSPGTGIGLLSVADDFTLGMGTTPVPEPGTLAMLLGGLAGLVVLGWRRRT